MATSANSECNIKCNFCDAVFETTFKGKKHLTVEHSDLPSTKQLVKYLKLDLSRKCKRASSHVRNNYILGFKKIDENSYRVKSFVYRDRYIVTKDREKACKNTRCDLVCDDCRICYHEYSCTCPDSDFNEHMCKHIHLVGSYLQGEISEDSGSDDESNESSDENDESMEDSQSDDEDAECQMEIVDYVNVGVSNISNPLGLIEEQECVSIIPLDFGANNELTEYDNEESKELWLGRMMNVIRVLNFGSEGFPPATWQEMKYLHDKYFVQFQPTLDALRNGQLEGEDNKLDGAEKEILHEEHG